MTVTTSTDRKTQIRIEVNRRRRENLVIRGTTELYIDKLKQLGCIYDPKEFLWLAPDATVLATIATFPGLKTGTEGPRLDGMQWPSWCRGWAVLDLPQRYAEQWLASIVPDDDVELYRFMKFRARGGRAKGLTSAKPQLTPEQIAAREAAQRAEYQRWIEQQRRRAEEDQRLAREQAELDRIVRQIEALPLMERQALIEEAIAARPGLRVLPQRQVIEAIAIRMSAQKIKPEVIEPPACELLLSP